MVAIVLIALVGVAIACFPALASAATATGEITRAEASADWTEGSFAGSVRWGGCELPVIPFFWEEEGRPGTRPPTFPRRCEITPFATVAPGDDPAECWSDERQWPHSAGAQHLGWEGATVPFPGSATFDVPSAALSGTPGQLVCLSVLQIHEERPRCAYQLGVFCPLWIALVPTYRVAAAAVLPESGSAEFFGPVPAPPGESETEEGSSPEVEEASPEEDKIAEQGQLAVPEPMPPPNADGPGAAGAPASSGVEAQQRRCTRVHPRHSHRKKRGGKYRGHRSHKKCVTAPPA
ncbi:MAG TPA: hypothetical protein VFJ57_11860 [Solirubrobacterales bacterium]|nr:hypothetical protein [Solirubrobacterales bacterium]